MDLRKRFAADLHQKLREAARNLKDANPEYQDLLYSAELRSYRKTPRGWSKHPERIVNGLLTNQSFRRATNREIVAKVAEWFAPYQPSESIMTRRLTASARKAIQARLNEHGVNITVRPDDTLSKLKKAIRAGPREDEAKTVSGSVEITEDFVIANGKPYRIDKSRKHPAIRVTLEGKRPYLRCDHLKALLAGPSDYSSTM